MQTDNPGGGEKPGGGAWNLRGVEPAGARSPPGRGAHEGRQPPEESGRRGRLAEREGHRRDVKNMGESARDGRSNGKLPRTEPLTAAEGQHNAVASLMDVPLRRTVELDRIDAPEDEVAPLLERGILPGCRLLRIRNSPGGDPIISVAGTLLALRREAAAKLFVRPTQEPDAGQAPATGV